MITLRPPPIHRPSSVSVEVLAGPVFKPARFQPLTSRTNGRHPSAA
jgi:hypothetical protein